MRKYLLLLFFTLFSFSVIHAEIEWTVSNDGTLTISGTNMPNYNKYATQITPWYAYSYMIKKVIIEDGVTNIGSYAFYECNNFTSISIPNSVTSIGENAFFGCSRLTSVTIGNSVTSIGKYAFSGCGFTSITIPNSVTSIGKDAFSWCEKLTSITIPNSVTSIGENAFCNCSSLTSITIPNSVTSIGFGAFMWCFGLTSVTNLATTPQIISSETFSVYGTLLHVLPGCKTKYEAADYWQNFTIVEDATTGIYVVENTSTISSDKVFSISGQRLNSTKKGVNIINGKKILVE